MPEARLVPLRLRIAQEPFPLWSNVYGIIVFERIGRGHRTGLMLRSRPFDDLPRDQWQCFCQSPKACFAQLQRSLNVLLSRIVTRDATRVHGATVIIAANVDVEDRGYDRAVVAQSPKLDIDYCLACGEGGDDLCGQFMILRRDDP